MRKHSSLLVRTRPTSVTPPLTICTETPLPWPDTPDRTYCWRPVSTLTDTPASRTAMNPTDYSLFRYISPRRILVRTTCAPAGRGVTGSFRLQSHYALATFGVCIRAGVRIVGDLSFRAFVPTSTASLFRSHSAAAETHRFRRNRHSRSARRERSSYTGRHGEFLQRRSPRHQYHRARVVCRSPQSRRNLRYDCVAARPCLRHHPHARRSPFLLSPGFLCAYFCFPS